MDLPLELLKVRFIDIHMDMGSIRMRVTPSEATLYSQWLAILNLLTLPYR